MAKLILLLSWLLILSAIAIEILYSHIAMFTVSQGLMSCAWYFLPYATFCILLALRQNHSKAILVFSVATGLLLPLIYAIGCAQLYFCGFSDGGEYLPEIVLPVLQILTTLVVTFINVILMRTLRPRPRLDDSRS